LAALTAGIMIVQCTSILLASDSERAATPTDTRLANDSEHAATPTRSGLTFEGKPLLASVPLTAVESRAVTGPMLGAPVESRAAFGQWGRGYRRGRGRNAAAATAIFLGAAGTIAGTALLVYAGRPECGANPELGGCGYGTKVLGGAVLSAGLVGVMVGALTWR
jgi:hypothetical protein